MSKPVQAAHQIEEAFLEDGAQDDTHPGDRARPIPRISIQAFCEDARVAEALQYAAADRRLAKSHVSVHMGGIAAAVAHYRESPTPNLIIVESALPRDRRLSRARPARGMLRSGHESGRHRPRHNDVVLYRELLKRGVSEYLVAPVAPMQLMESLSNLYNNPDTDPVGNVIAFIGAKGGVGSSTVCHNVAWAMSEILKTNVVVADLDLAFGTTGPRLQSGSGAGHRGSAASPERLDEVLLDRLLTKCSEHLSHLRRAGRARPRLRYLGRCLRPGHRRRAPERALRCRRSAAHLDAVVEARAVAGR